MRELTRLKKEIDQMYDVVAKRASLYYDTERDKKGYLYITYKDSYQERLPSINFRPYQEYIQKKLFIESYNRFVLCRPRRAGKEVESWNLLIQGAVETPGTYLMVYPTSVRARGILWEGNMTLPNGKSLPFLQMLPQRLIESLKNDEMKVFMKNGSVIWIVGSNIDPDKLRGTNPRGIVFSEHAYQDETVYYNVMPILRQNGGWLLSQSTFNGMNFFYDIIKKNKDNDEWICRIDSIKTLLDHKGNRFITDEEVEQDRRAGMPEYLINQEYYSVVQLNEESHIFAHQMKFLEENDHINTDVIKPNAPLYTAWDLGGSGKDADRTFIVLFQLIPSQFFTKILVVGAIQGQNQERNWYLGQIRRFANERQLVLDKHLAPHDGKNKTFNVDTDIVEWGHTQGEQFIIVPRPNSKQNAIETVREYLYKTYIHKQDAQSLLDALRNYQKEYDKNLGRYKHYPLHNWASHGADAFQTLVLGVNAGMINTRPMEINYYA